VLCALGSRVRAASVQALLPPAELLQSSLLFSMATPTSMSLFQYTNAPGKLPRLAYPLSSRLLATKLSNRFSHFALHTAPSQAPRGPVGFPLLCQHSEASMWSRFRRQPLRGFFSPGRCSVAPIMPNDFHASVAPIMPHDFPSMANKLRSSKQCVGVLREHPI
jgi:hypothetical protein